MERIERVQRVFGMRRSDPRWQKVAGQFILGLITYGEMVERAGALELERGRANA